MTDDNKRAGTDQAWHGDSSWGASNQHAAGSQKEPGWEQQLVTDIALSAIKEQRRSRRWGIFFKLVVLGYLLAVFVIYFADGDADAGSSSGGKHTALVEINGVIAADADANADQVVTGLRAAFENKNTAAVILRINSPGGSPVQAGYINDEITRLRAKYDTIPVYAVITDMCASGGYYIAAAADEIYADKASVVGSIGVIMNGFGFVDAMDKLGVERRMFTAGDSKGFLDPFSPLKDQDLDHVRSLLDSIHQQFIRVVKEGRGERLKDESSLFSGLVWTGEQAVELGLVDQLGSSSYVAREVVGVEEIRNFTRQQPYFERMAERLGVSFANALRTSFFMDGVR